MSGVADDTQRLSTALDGLCGADDAELADGELLHELCRHLERLGAVVTKAAAAFAAGGRWEADGARSAPAWMAARCGQPVAAARRRVWLGRALRAMPRVEAAWLAGDIGEAHAGALAAARTPATAACFERDEALLVEHARALSYRHFARALAYWRQLADPDGTEAEAEGAHRARRLHLSPTLDGAWAIEGQLDAVGGAIVSEALRRIVDELFATDWAEARNRVGNSVCGADLARTPAQRRVDALVEMATRAGAVAAGGRRPEPLFNVLVGYKTFAGRICELADGTVVSPGSLVRWPDQAWIERVVFDGPDRIKNVGVRRRLFDGATRRAIEMRDRECYSEFCEERFDGCEIDHIQPWSAGGLTDEANGRFACGYHNRRRHPLAPCRRRGPDSSRSA